MYPSDQPEEAEKREADDQEDDESPSTEHQQDGDGHDNETQNDENVVSVEEDPEPEGNPESEEDPEPEGNPESEEDPEPEGDPELERDEEHGEENHDNVGPEQSNNPDGEEQTPTNVPENDSIQHRIALPLNDHQGQTSNHALKALDMKVLESTMDRETLKTVLTIGVKAFRTSDDYSEMAKIIKTEMLEFNFYQDHIL